MLLQPFLTDLDTRAAVKGSRDPLGVQPIWTRFGRRIVGNLTTVSTSVRDFTALLMGYYFVQRIEDAGGTEAPMSVMLKWEQLAAYARAEINKDWTFRGTERVKKALGAGSRVRIAADSSAQILSNQRIYGISGVYTVAARSSGFLVGEPLRLAPVAHKLVEDVYLPLFAEAGMREATEIVSRLGESHFVLDVRGNGRRLLEPIGKLLQRRVRAAERGVYQDGLLKGGPLDRTAGIQEVLAHVLSKSLDDPDWRLASGSMKRLERAARSQGAQGERLADHLNRIRTCESLLAPAVACFSLLMGSEGQTPRQVATTMRKHWGESVSSIDAGAVSALESEVSEATGDAESGAKWTRTAQAFADGQYELAISLLLDLNCAVMKARAGTAAWIELRGDYLRVRFRDDDNPSLPARDELRDYWVHSYFIHALRMMLLELRA